MLTSNQFIQEIRNYCINNANEENAKKSQRYFKETYNGYGLSTLQINQKATELLKTKELNIDVVLEAIPRLLEYGKFEEISCGLMVLNGLEKEYSKKVFADIAKFYKNGITNWAHADVLGMYILPKFLLKEIITTNDFEGWINSPLKFQRRSIPVTLIKKIKKDKNCSECINFIIPLMSDTEREVQQGVGWFLRECWKIDPKKTEKFLLQWKDAAPRIIMQYACEKMAVEEKQKYKRSK